MRVKHTLRDPLQDLVFRLLLLSSSFVGWEKGLGEIELLSSIFKDDNEAKKAISEEGIWDLDGPLRRITALEVWGKRAKLGSMS